MERDFAKRLKELRNSRHFTQEQLAVITNIYVGTIRKYEQDTCKPLALNLLKLANALDVTPEYLLLGENNMNTYTEAIKKELLQLNEYDKIFQIKREKLNSTILSHLELAEDLIDDITTAWNSAGIFKRKNDKGIIEDSYCTRSYVQQVVIRYCQNRVKYKERYGIIDGSFLV